MNYINNNAAMCGFSLDEHEMFCWDLRGSSSTWGEG